MYFAEIEGLFKDTLSEPDFIKLIERLIGIETLDTVKFLFSHKLFVLYGLQTIEFIQDHWLMYSNHPIIPYLFYYFQSKSLYGDDDDFFHVEQNQLNKLKLKVTPKNWSDGSSPFFQSAQRIVDNSSFPINAEESYLGFHLLDLRQTDDKEKFSQLIAQTQKKPNSSAIFFVFDGTYVEPVCIINYQNQTNILLSNSHHIHTSTKEIIKKFKLQVVHCDGMPLHHDGDCAYYSMIALNTIISLATNEKSMLSVLKPLQTNHLDLASYFLTINHFNAIDCNLIKTIPDTKALTRMLQKIRDILKALRIEEGFSNLLTENHINSVSFTLQTNHLPPSEKNDFNEPTVLSIPVEEPRVITDKLVKQPEDFIPSAVLTTPVEESQAITNRLIKEQDDKISTILQTFSDKISLINKPLVPDAVEEARKLHAALIETKNTYLSKLSNTDNQQQATREFTQDCTQLIQNALPTLQRELGWGTYLTNLLKKLVNSILSIIPCNHTFFAYKKSELNSAAQTVNDELDDLNLLTH